MRVQSRGLTGVALLTVSLLLAGLFPAVGQVGSGERRVADSEDATLASVAISQDAFPGDGTAAGVVIATSGDFADALAGSPLAGRTRPILFTDPSPAPLRDEVLAEVRRAVGPAGGCDGIAADGFEVAILGGNAAVSDDAAATLEAEGYCVERFAGAGREQTAVAVAEAVLKPSTSARGDGRVTVLLARRDNVADAAPGGAFGAFGEVPLVVTPTDLLHPATRDFLAARQPDEVVILGGTAAISEGVADELADLAGIVRRVSGPSRDATAVAIASGLWPADVDSVVLVNGFSDRAFVYALAAGPLAALEQAPVVYTQRDQLPPATVDFLSSVDPGGAGREVTQILSGPSAQIAFDPGEGFDPPPPPGLPLVAASDTGFGTGRLHHAPDVLAVDELADMSTTPTGGREATWAPDHRTTFYATEIVDQSSDAADIVAFTPSTGEMRVLFTGQVGEFITAPVPSPDGRLLTFNTNIPTQIGAIAVAVLDLSTDPPSVVAQGLRAGGQDTILASRQPFTADGQLLVRADGTISSIPVTGGAATPIAAGSQAAHNPRQDLIAVRGDDGVTLHRGDGSLVGTLDVDSLVDPVFSGDGRFLMTGDRQSNPGIPQALRCPAEVTSADACIRVQVFDGWAGSGTISPDGSVMVAEFQPFEPFEGFTIVDLTDPDDPTATDVVQTEQGTNQSADTYAPSVPVYCPVPADPARFPTC